MKRIGGLALVAVCIGVLSNCAAPLGLSARDNGNNSGGFSNFSGDMSGGGSVDSGVAEATATKVRESQASSSESRAGGGVLPPLGEFDRTEPGFQVFDPCLEIPGETFSELKLQMTSEPEKESGYRTCFFSKDLGNGREAAIALAAQHEGMDRIRELYPEAYFGPDNAQEGIYTVEDTFIKGATCTSYVETTRGVISVAWTELRADVSMQEKCEQSRKLLLELF